MRCDEHMHTCIEQDCTNASAGKRCEKHKSQYRKITATPEFEHAAQLEWAKRLLNMEGFVVLSESETLPFAIERVESNGYSLVRKEYEVEAAPFQW